MAWNDYEKLQCFGEFGLTVSVSFDLLKFPKPGGYRDAAVITGRSEGTKRFSLKFDYLPKTVGDYGVDAGAELGGLQSRADYLWAFFVRHKQQGDKPFILEFDMPGQTGLQQMLCLFADDEMVYTHFAARMFSTGLNLEQVFEEGWQQGTDQVQFDNPVVL